jgi:hypothetical protein
MIPGAMSLPLWLSVALNIVLVLALLFKSALNAIVVDWYTRRQQRREGRRTMLLDLHEHMGLFDAHYMVITGMSLLNAAADDLDLDRAGDVRAASARLDEMFSGPFQADLDFVNRHELEMPARIRDHIVRLREAMRVADVDAMTDPADVERRTSAVKNAVQDIRTEIRRLVT